MRGSKFDKEPAKPLNRINNKIKSQTNIKLVAKQK